VLLIRKDVHGVGMNLGAMVAVIRAKSHWSTTSGEMASIVKPARKYIAVNKLLMKRINVIGLELATNARKAMSLSHSPGLFWKPLPKPLQVFSPLRWWGQHLINFWTKKMDMMKRFCCPPDEMKKWKNCGWHGNPGSCNDNQCPLGHSVQLATNAYGRGETCWPRFERDRVFCCDPSNNKSPFLPVPLDHLFPHPPKGENVDSDYKLEVDNTWGDGKADTADKEPNDASFGFVVLTSPEKLQTSLDKRDGSHWELFNCNDAVSEDEQTIQMFCTDVSENSNCHKISSGGFVAGTILEMPPGCGPSKYAVAKSMAPAADQSLPEHLAKRNYRHQPTVYDLTFDFEWHRVRRDLGETQMRVDFSNEVVSDWDDRSYQAKLCALLGMPTVVRADSSILGLLG